MSPSEHGDAAALDLRGAGDEGEQRGLADPVGADQADDAAGRQAEADAVEGERRAVAMAQPIEDARRARAEGSPVTLGLEHCGPGQLGIEPDIADAGKAGPHQIGMSAQQRRVDLDPDPEHELVALAPGLDHLGRELRLVGDEKDLRRQGLVGQGIEQDAALAADDDLARLQGRQEDVHIDVGEVEHGEDLSAGGQHLAEIGQPVLDAAVLRGATSVLSAMLTWSSATSWVAASRAWVAWPMRASAAMSAAVGRVHLLLALVSRSSWVA